MCSITSKGNLTTIQIRMEIKTIHEGRVCSSFSSITFPYQRPAVPTMPKRKFLCAMCNGSKPSKAAPAVADFDAQGTPKNFQPKKFPVFVLNQGSQIHFTQKNFKELPKLKKGMLNLKGIPTSPFPLSSNVILQRSPPIFVEAGLYSVPYEGSRCHWQRFQDTMHCQET